MRVLSISIMLLIVAVMMGLAPRLGTSPAQAEPLAPPPTQNDGRVILKVDTSNTTARAHIGPPPQALAKRPNATTITVTYLAAGDTMGEDTCYTWPNEAKAAFEYAKSIWAGLVSSPVPITINACWYTDVDTTTLGYNFLGTSSSNFVGAPMADTLYAPALANALHGADLRPGEADTNIAINQTFTWYTGTDGNPGPNEMDMVSVVIHEMGHGLGFSGGMRYGSQSCGNPAYGCWGTLPKVYDQFTEVITGQLLINTYGNPSAELGSALTGGDIWFNGQDAKQANGGGRVKLYAPPTWASGSSYTHLDYLTYRNTVNRLMVYALSAGSSIHDPGPVTCGILRDMGWRNACNPASDVGIHKAVLGSQFKPGDFITFTLAFSNNGTVTATDTVITDLVPVEVINPSYDSSLPVTLTGVHSYVWQVGKLSAGQTGVITLYGQISPSLQGGVSFTNTAMIWALQDEVSSNNTSHVRVSGETKVYLPAVLNNYFEVTPGRWGGSPAAEFLVNSTRTALTHFTSTVNLPGCGSLRISVYGTIPISNKRFSVLNVSGTFTATGTFNSGTSASGLARTINIGPYCDQFWNLTWNWTATWQGNTLVFHEARVKSVDAIRPPLHLEEQAAAR